MTELLKPYLLSDNPNVLEFFARTTFPGIGESGTWTSVGNECIKFNELGNWLVPEETVV